MRFLLILLFAVFLHQQGLTQVTNDSAIVTVLSVINQDSIKEKIQMLENFTTRFCLFQNRFKVADSVYNRFTAMGFTNVERDSFLSTINYNGDTTTLQVNIIATIEGQYYPDKIYIIGAHYDSYSMGPKELAPGADDDASGVAALLEIASAFKKSGLIPAATIKFIAFAAEEIFYFGNAGSEHYASLADSSGMDIRMMLNLDMISYSTYSPSNSKISIRRYSGFEYLGTLAKNTIEMFTPLTGVYGAMNTGSDSYAFYEKGIPALMLMENQFSPYYHTDFDQVARYNMEYCAEVTRSAAAILLKAQNWLTDYEDENNNKPLQFALMNNYPNPFNPSTTIKYSVASEEKVTLSIYNILGNKIRDLINERKSPGEYSVVFDASGLPSGIYLCKLTAGDKSFIRKMIYLK